MVTSFVSAERARAADPSVRTPPRLPAVRSLLEQRACVSDPSAAPSSSDSRQEARSHSTAAPQSTFAGPLLAGQAEERFRQGQRPGLHADWTLSPITPSVRQTPLGRRPSIYTMPENWSGTPPDLPNPSLGAFYSWRLGSPMPRNDRIRAMRSWPMHRPSVAQGTDIYAAAGESSLTEERERNALNGAVEPHPDRVQTDDDSFSPGNADLGLAPSVPVSPPYLNANSPALSNANYAGVAAPLTAGNGPESTGAVPTGTLFDAGLVTGCSLLQPVSWPTTAAAMTPLTARLREQSRVAADLDPDFAQVALATNDRRLLIKRYQQFYGSSSSTAAPIRALSDSGQLPATDSIQAMTRSAETGPRSLPSNMNQTLMQTETVHWTAYPTADPRMDAPQKFVSKTIAEMSQAPSAEVPAANIAGLYYRLEDHAFFDSNSMDDADDDNDVADVDENCSFASPFEAGAATKNASFHPAQSSAMSTRVPLVDSASELNRFGLGSLRVLHERQLPNHAYAVIADEHHPVWNANSFQEALSPRSTQTRSEALVASLGTQTAMHEDDRLPVLQVPVQDTEPPFLDGREAFVPEPELPTILRTQKTSRHIHLRLRHESESKRVVFADHALEACSMQPPSEEYAIGKKHPSRKQRTPHHVPLDASAMSTTDESSVTTSVLGQRTIFSPCASLLPPCAKALSAPISSVRGNRPKETRRASTRCDAGASGLGSSASDPWAYEPMSHASEPPVHKMVSLVERHTDPSTDAYTTTGGGGFTALAIDPIAAAELKRASRRLQTPRAQPQKANIKRCRCRRSRCLKKYCDCFAAGNFCGPECECENCGNHEENRWEVEQLRQNASQRSNASGEGLAGDSSVAEMVSQRRCRCKRTGCLKRYCECYQAGRECTAHCSCEGCYNCRGQSEHLLVEIRRRLAQVR
jgi:hypothetical protein